MELRLPKELILLATVHGGIFVEDRNVNTFVVPEGMKITRIMATRPGVCNVTTEEQIDNVVTDMKESGVAPKDIQTALSNIKSAQTEVVKSVMGQLKADDPNKALFQQFIQSRIATPTVKVFNAGDTMLNKFLARSAEEGREQAFDYKLNALNMPGKPDLFDLIPFGSAGPAARTRSKTPHGRELFLSNVVGVLRQQGVEHLILYDFTCSSFMGDEMDPRTEREVRRFILQNGWGKTRRRKHKTKTRKAKKRRALWSR